MKLKKIHIKYPESITKRYRYFIEIFKESKYEYIVKVDIVDIKVKTSLESLKILKDIENNISSFEVLEGNMDQVFINLTGKEIRGE